MVKILVNFLYFWLLILIYQFPFVLCKRIYSHVLCLNASLIHFSLISMPYFILDFLLSYDPTIFSLLTKSWIVYLYETGAPWTLSWVNHTKVHFVHILTHIQVNHASGKFRCNCEWKDSPVSKCLFSKVIEMSEVSQRFSFDYWNCKQLHMINTEMYADIRNNFIRKSRAMSGYGFLYGIYICIFILCDMEFLHCYELK
jgi:hypothetical protein